MHISFALWGIGMIVVIPCLHSVYCNVIYSLYISTNDKKSNKATLAALSFFNLSESFWMVACLAITKAVISEHILRGANAFFKYVWLSIQNKKILCLHCRETGHMYCFDCSIFFLSLANFTGHTERVGMENFELLKVLGTGGK